MNQEEKDKLWARFAQARLTMQNAINQKAMSNATEGMYGNAYQDLVKAGLAGQLRGKYRVR